MSEHYCRFARKKRYVCNYEPEERTTDFCLICRVTKLVNQQDLMIKQNKAIIAILNQTRELLAELKGHPVREKSESRSPIDSRITVRG